jgi:hypothetical protein
MERDFVLMRADLTGLMIVPLVVLVTATQSDQTDDEQTPSLNKFKTLLFSTNLASWSVGLMCSIPSATKAFSSVWVVCSN